MARYDWEAIKADYRTGRYSLQQLSDRHGPNKSTISKKADKEGWEKDLSEAVRQRTREKVSRAQLDAAAREVLDKSDEELVEEAASQNAAIVHGHRRHLERWRSLAGRYAELLESQLERGALVVQLKNGDVAQVDLPLDYVGKSMASGTQALERVVKLERQAYGMDEPAGEEVPEERRLSDEELRNRIAELEAKRKVEA